jgi:hypothetical protein
MGQRLVILKMNNMNLQEQINRIHEMMGVINENKLTDFFHKRFDKIFDELE